MKTLRFIITTLLILSTINIGFSQDKDKRIKELEEDKELLKDIKERLEKDIKSFTDSLITQNNTIKSLEDNNKTLANERNDWKEKHGKSESAKGKLAKKVKDYDAKLKEIEKLKKEHIDDLATIKNLEAQVKVLDKNVARKDLKELKVQYKTLSEKFDKQTKELARLREVEIERNNLKSILESCEKIKIAKIQEVVAIEKKFQLSEEKSLRKDEYLKAFAGFKDEAIKTIKSEIPLLVVSNKFYTSDEKIVGYEKQIAMIKTVVGNDDKELNDLGAKLAIFKQSTETLKSTRAVLNEVYNSVKVKNAITKLEGFNNTSNAHFNREKKNILHLLRNYCRCYQEAYSLFDGLKSYNGRSGQARLVSNDIGYFRVYKESKSQIFIYDEYPYIQQIIKQREKSPTNTSFTLPEISCN